MEEEKNEAAEKNWGEVLRSFTRETTFHGVKYIAEESRFMSRRIAWIIVVISVIITFAYAIASRLSHYYDYPSNIQVEVGYLDQVPFPAVTMCNMNPYRLSALQKYGLYDIMIHTYSQKMEPGNECQEHYLLNPLICDIPHDAAFTEVFVETTVSVCKELCSHLFEAELCSGFVYDGITRSCTITSFTGENTVWFNESTADYKRSNCAERKKYFYRKRRCLDADRIFCNFEDDTMDSAETFSSRCRFRTDTSVSGTWEKVTGSIPDVTYDNTIGHFLLFRETKKTENSIARIKTVNYLNTTGRCIFIFLSQRGRENEIKGQFRVITRTESQLTTTELTLDPGDPTPVQYGENWMPLFHALPDGIHKVILEAEQVANIGNNFMLDNIEITTCGNIRRNCIQSVKGAEYMGNISMSKTGQPCEMWKKYFYTDKDKYKNAVNLLFPGENVISLQNQCRHANFLNPASPVCVVVTPNTDDVVEECQIERCACNEADEFTCSDGICIPSSRICDGKIHCNDGSDEGIICDNKRRISCDFEDGFICGYWQINTVQMEWQPSKITYYSTKSLNLERDPLVIRGEMAIITSPPERFSSNRVIQFRLKALQPNTGNAISIWLYGNHGLSKAPIIHINPGSEQNDWIIANYTKLASDCKGISDGWKQCHFCVPGGPEMIHRLIITGLYQKDDTFTIDKIRMTDDGCDTELASSSTVFPYNESVSEDFNSGHHFYGHLPDHMNMHWEFMSHDSVHSTMELLQENSLASADCDLCLQYQGKMYNFVYFNDSGVIQTSGYPDEYTNYQESIWLIEMPEGDRIKITFLDFDVHFSDDCSRDYIQIEEPATPLKRLCGSLPQQPYSSLGNIVTLTFKTDDSINMKGVSLHYERIYISHAQTDLALALLYTGPFSEWRYKSRLITPVIDTTIKESCLVFHYIKTNPMSVHLQLLNDSTVMIYEDGFEDSYIDWRKAHVTFENPTAGSTLVFTGQKSADQKFQYDLVLDNIMLHDFPCSDLPNQDFSNVNCTFDNFNQCGYKEVSSPAGQWIRRRETKDRYSMYYSHYNGPSPTVLLSPLFTLDTDSCLIFVVECPWCDVSGIINVTLFDTSSHNVTSNLAWVSNTLEEEIQFNVSKTLYRFGLAAVSKYGFMYMPMKYLIVYSISLTPSNCQPQGNGPLSGKGWGLTTVSFEDALSSVANVSTVYIREEPKAVPDNTTYVTEFYLDSDKAHDITIDSHDITAKELLQHITHQKENFLLSCYWNGQPCEDSFINTTMTDLGQCVTFNSKMEDSSTLYSKRSGSQFGLQMIINTENYEHVEGIGTDSGVKIHFQSEKEIANMKSMGFAVSPGTHTMFSLKYTTSSFLEPQYGTCGEMELSSFPNITYTTSHCVTQCATDNLYKDCQCLLPYMPKSNNSICTLRQYLKCVIPQAQESDMSCDCPDACNQTNYDVQLSHSTLSGLAIGTILSGKKRKVQTDFYRTTELHHRVRAEDFLDIALKIKEISIEILQFKSFLGNYTEFIGQVIKSGILKIKDMNRLDANPSFYQFQKHHRLYADYMKPERSSIVNSFNKVSMALQQFAIDLKWKTPCTSDNAESTEFGMANLKADLKLLDAFLVSYMKSYSCEGSETNAEAPSIAVFPDYVCQGYWWAFNEVMPHKAVKDKTKYEICKGFYLEIWPYIFMDILNNLATFLHLMTAIPPYHYYWGPTNYASSNYSFYYNFPESSGDVEEPLGYEYYFTSNNTNNISCDTSSYSFFVDIFYDIANQFRDTVQMITPCFYDYGEFLDASLADMEHMIRRNEEDNILNITPFDISSLDGITNWLDQLYSKYGATDLSKLNLTDALLSELQLGSLSYLQDLIATYSNRFEQDTIASVRMQLRELESSITVNYETLINDYLAFSEYMRHRINSDHFRKLHIFRRPRPSLQDANLISYRLTEKQVQRLVGSKPVAFLRNSGLTLATEAIKDYFTGLDDIMSNFHIEFADVKGRLMASVTELKEALVNYKEGLTLGSEFIRENIMQVDVYFGELKFYKTSQNKGYGIGDFFSDLGGYLGLLLGASVVTVCEILDVMLYNIASYSLKKKEKRRLSKTHENGKNDMSNHI